MNNQILIHIAIASANADFHNWYFLIFGVRQPCLKSLEQAVVFKVVFICPHAWKDANVFDWIQCVIWLTSTMCQCTDLQYLSFHVSLNILLLTSSLNTLPTNLYSGISWAAYRKRLLVQDSVWIWLTSYAFCQQRKINTLGSWTELSFTFLLYVYSAKLLWGSLAVTAPNPHGVSNIKPNSALNRV